MISLNFIKNAINNRIDEFTHKKFVRYGVGEFEKEPFEVRKGKSSFTVKTGPEYFDVLEHFFIENIKSETTAKGKIIAQKDVIGVYKKFGIKPVKMTSNGKKSEFSHTFSNEELKNFFEELKDCFVLCDLASGKNTLKMKKSLGKPGKPMENFCSAKLDISLFDKFKEEFAWDAGDFNNLIIKHTYIIKELIIDDRLVEEDPARARLEAKRKGIIIREIDVDGKKIVKEHEFLV
ncbi:hypothetical protein D6745_04120 [Candidatus Woesearchaeota archaeon]|nr:MAG: hypothetical protein D6745_04120 [Candidatus Woesearchaeota archaeon]